MTTRRHLVPTIMLFIGLCVNSYLYYDQNVNRNNTHLYQIWTYLYGFMATVLAALCFQEIRDSDIHSMYDIFYPTRINTLILTLIGFLSYTALNTINLTYRPIYFNITYVSEALFIYFAGLYTRLTI
jgi:hypothetical protein